MLHKCFSIHLNIVLSSQPTLRPEASQSTFHIQLMLNINTLPGILTAIVILAFIPICGLSAS